MSGQFYFYHIQNESECQEDLNSHVSECQENLSYNHVSEYQENFIFIFVRKYDKISGNLFFLIVKNMSECQEYFIL